MNDNLKKLDPILYKKRLNVLRVQKCQARKRSEDIVAFKEKHRIAEAKSKIVRKLKRKIEKDNAEVAVRMFADTYHRKTSATSRVTRSLSRSEDVSAIVRSASIVVFDPKQHLRVLFEPAANCIGLLTIAEINKEDYIGSYNVKGGTLIKDRETYLKTMKTNKRRYLINIGNSNTFFDPTTSRDKTMMRINHGCERCEANVHLQRMTDNELRMVACKNIKAFKYLRWDYGMEWTFDDAKDSTLDWLRDYKCSCRGYWVPRDRLLDWRGVMDPAHPHNSCTPLMDISKSVSVSS